jgi:LmbE family N-acetylglucosaminyl deacetylase
MLEIARDLGVEKRFYHYGYHQVRYNDEGIRLLTDLVVEVEPDLVLTHWPFDFWPDHEATGKLARHTVRFPHGLHRDTTLSPRLFNFEAGANQVDPSVPFQPDIYIDITEEMDQVCEVIHRLDEVADGQTIAGPSGHELDKRAKSRLRGSECGVAYAEAFLALKKSPQDILL